MVGRKIGLTSPAVQRQLGVDQPDFGVLFADMDVSAEAEVPSWRLLQPRAEAEIAFVLKEDLADGDLDVARVRSAVDHAVAALEIVDSRIADWDIRLTDTVADNASSGRPALTARAEAAAGPAGGVPWIPPVPGGGAPLHAGHLQQQSGGGPRPRPPGGP